MVAWAIRGGKESQYEKPAIETGKFTTGWNNLGDLSSLQSRDEMKDLLWEKDPKAKTGAIANYATHLWRFRQVIAIYDLVVMPRQHQPGSVAIGTITSDYQYQPDNPAAPHIRTVEWINTEFPKSLLRADIEKSLKFGQHSIFRINHPNAEEYLRIAAQLSRAKHNETAIQNYLSENYPHLTNG